MTKWFLIRLFHRQPKPRDGVRNEGHTLLALLGILPQGIFNLSEIFMKLTHAIFAAAAITASCAALAATNPEAEHPNIIAASHDVQSALEKMKAAQTANEYDMGGHAAKAEELLHKAQHQMEMAAGAANKHDKMDKK